MSTNNDDLSRAMRDRRMSLKARGLLALVASLDDSCQISPDDLSDIVGVDDLEIRHLLAELAVGGHHLTLVRESGE